MKSANAESLKRLRPRLSLTLFTSTLFTSLILLSFLMVGTMLAQNESVSVQVGAEDRAAGTYGTSNFRYHILPARTLAGSAARSARTTKPSRTSAPIASSGGFFPADLTRGSGPLVKRAIFHDIDFDCAESCWGNPSAFLNDLGKQHLHPRGRSIRRCDRQWAIHRGRKRLRQRASFHQHAGPE